MIVGTGNVGASIGFALVNQRTAVDELILTDINAGDAEGEAMDLNHGLAFSGSNMKIYAGGYTDCRDADLVVICAGVAQKPGDALDNCRFPGSVWSEQNHDLPVRNSKIHIVHCYIISIRFAQSLYFQHKSSYSAGVSEYILHICIEKSRTTVLFI